MTWLLLLAATAAPPDLAAVGMVTSPDAGKSVALVRSGGRTRVVGVGESAFGGRVRAVEPGRVVLEFDGQTVELRLPAGLPGRSALVRPSAPIAAGPAGYTVERREFERRLGEETGRILAETTLTPVQSGSQVTGYALSRIPDGTVLSDAGLQAGDVLTSVNDVPIDSLATLVGLYPRLQTESSVRAVVLRNGSPVTLTVQLR